MRPPLKYIFLTPVILFSQITLALSDELVYPELQVSPKATERLQMELRKESSNKYLTHLPIQLSSLMTLTSGLYSQNTKLENSESSSKKDENTKSQRIATSVGGAWLIGTFLLGEFYKPYQNAAIEIKSLPNQSMQDQLVRERIVEENFARAAALAQKLTWFSVATNMAASTYVASNTTGDARTFAGISALTALAPLLFRYSWIEVNNYHQDYKKKIYAPVVSSYLFQNNEKLSPGILMSWNF